jgi:endo-1,4-beta-xylanase
VWHSQLAPWVEAKKDWTPDTLRATITAHITNVAGHWKGRCYAWDVVNEALNEDGTWRDSVFYRVLGPDFIKHAFRVASEVDPKAKLYYNDYNLESPGKKSEAAVGIVKMLKADGIKIDGIGMQAHLVAEGHPTLDEHVAVIQSYAAAGVEVALTELDVRLKLPVTAENLELQKVAYKNVSNLPVAFRPVSLFFMASF